MNRQEIETKVKEIIVEKLGVEDKDVTVEKDYRNDFGCDSLDFVDLLMEIEKEFKISITDDMAKQATTVGKTVDIIEELI